MIIVGLTGGISHGKTTFATLLGSQSRTARHFETWELVAEVAGALRSDNPVHPAPDDIEAINHWLLPLNDIVSQIVHVSVDYLALRITNSKLQENPDHYIKLFEYLQLVSAQPELATIDITADNKQLFRPLLQWLGGFLVLTAGTGVWYDEILRRISLLQSSGCDLVTVGGVRFPGDAERLRNGGGIIIHIERPGLPQQDIADITERERDLIRPECAVINNGDLSELGACAALVYQDLRRRSLAGSYQAQKTTATPPLKTTQN